MRHVHSVKGSPYLHYIRIVPADVREELKLSKWYINLKSASRNAVKKRVDDLTAEHSAAIEAARVKSGRVDILAGLSPDERDKVRNSGGVQGYLDWLEEQADRAAYAGQTALTLREKLEPNITRPLDAEGLSLDDGSYPGDEDEDDLAVTAAGLDAERATIERQLGAAVRTLKALGVSPDRKHHALTEAIAKGLPDDEITLSGVFEKWVVKKQPGTPEQYSYPVAMFESLHGALPVKAITFDHIRTFRDLLPKVPTASGGKFKNMSMTAMIEAAERKGVPRLSDVTARKYYGSIGTLFTFAVEENYLGSSPVRSLKWHAPKQKFYVVKKSRRSLSPDEMRRLLDAIPQWAGKDGIENLWFTRILVYTGCRPEELAQCSVSDISKVDGVLCFRFHDEGANKLKTESALRDVPVHPQLVVLGLNEFLATRSGPIFESLKADGRGRIYSRMAGRLKRFMTNKVGLKDRKIKPYSLRDSFVDSLRLVECPEAIEDAIIGHSDSKRKAARGYGGPQLTVVAKWVARADPLDSRRTVKHREDD